MIRIHMNRVLILSTLVFAVSACGGKTQNETSKSQLMYELSENGCSTGKKEFSSLSQYCASLQVDSANNYCAENLRRQTFARQCEGPFDQTSVFKQEPEQPVFQGDRGGSLPASEAPKPEGQKAEGALNGSARQTVQIPDEVILMAEPESPLRVTLKESENKILTTITGTLTVKTSSPDTTKRLMLMGAESHAIIDPSMEDCELVVNQFSDKDTDGKITFTLMGTDSKDGGISGCMKKLSPLGMTGFVARFVNVPVSQLSDKRYPSVTLKVVNAGGAAESK